MNHASAHDSRQQHRQTGRMAWFGFIALAVSVLIPSAVAAATPEDLVVTGTKDSLGFAKPVPVHISGFTGEAETVLKNDLLFMGVQHVPMDQALYLINGTVAG